MKLLTAIAATAAIALVGCSNEQADTLEKAFENEIDSAQISMRFDVDFRSGEDALLTMRGPIQRAQDEKLDRFDWTMRAEVAGSEAWEVRFVSTGDRVLALYKGTTYEATPEEMKEFRAQQNGEEPELEDVERLPGVDLKSWFPESDTEEDGEVDGEQTTHVSGRLDVSAALRDLAEMLRHPAVRSQLGTSKGVRLTEREIKMVDRLISDPRFDVHVAKSDDKLRRIAGRLSFRNPDRKALSGTVRFTFDLANVDEPVSVTAPEVEGRTRPLADLFKRWDAS